MTLKHSCLGLVFSRKSPAFFPSLLLSACSYSTFMLNLAEPECPRIWSHHSYHFWIMGRSSLCSPMAALNALSKIPFSISFRRSTLLSITLLSRSRPRGYNTFFMLNSVEHEILNAHKFRNIKKFGFC